MKVRYALIGAACTLLGAALVWALSPSLRALGYRSLMITGQDQIRHWALDQLAALGPEGTRALGIIGSNPEQDRTLRVEALYRIEVSSESCWPGIPPLLSAAVSDDEPLREQVELRLDSVNLGTEKASGWISIVEDPGSEPARRAVAALKIGMSPYVTQGEDIKALRGLIGSEPSLSRIALRALTHRQVRSLPALPALLERMSAGDDIERRLAAEAVGEVARPGDFEDQSPMLLALPLLEKSLRQDPNWRVRYRAAEALRKLRAPDPGVIEALRAAVSDPARQVRREALLALVTLAPDAELVAPLLESLATETGPERTKILWAFVSLGPAAAEAVPALHAILRSREDPDAVPVVLALEKIGRPAAATRAELLARFHDPETLSEWSENIARALWSVAPPEELRPIMLEGLAHSDSMVRHKAILGLKAASNRETRAALEELAEALGDRDELVRLTAIGALTELGPAAALTVPTLMRMIDDPTIELLGAIGPKAAPAIPLLVEACGQPELRFRALDAIARIDSSRLPIKALIEAYRDEDSIGLFGTPRGPSVEGIDRRQATPALLSALSSQDSSSRLAACRAAVTARDPDPRLTPALARSLAAEDEETRGLALEALRRIGPQARPAIPALRRVIEESEGALRLAAALALSFIDPSDRSLLKTLREETPEDDGERALAVLARARLGEEIGAARAYKAASELVGYWPLQGQLDLPELGPGLALIRSELLKILDHDALGARRDAVCLAGELGPGAAAAAPKLGALLESREAPIALRRLAIEALGSIGAAEPLARLLLRAEDRALYPDALRALTRTGRRGRRASESIRALLKDPELHGLALRALLAIDPEGAGSLVPELLAIEPAGVFPDGETVPETIRGLGDSARRLTPGLAAALADPRLTRRWSAAELLFVIGHRGAGAAAALAAAIPGERSAPARLAMLEALMAVDAEPALASPVLKALLDDEREAIRLAARRIIEDG